MAGGLTGAVKNAVRRAPLSWSKPLLERKVRAAQADPVMLRTARNQMEFVLGESRPDADLDAAALAHVEEMVWRAELRFRPEFLVDQPVTGIDKLHEHRGEHGGLLIAGLHHGRYDGMCGAMKRAGAPPLHVAANPEMFDENASPTVRAHAKVVQMGATLAPVSAGFRGMQALVEGGATLIWAFDMPGSTRVKFLGRELGVSSSMARLALNTDTPIVVGVPRRGPGFTQNLVLQDPILPSDHADAQSLLQAVLDALEPSVLDWPEGYVWPRPKFNRFDENGEKIVWERDPGEPVY
jgi:lauroyl/myristoyl acyltransferase